MILVDVVDLAFAVDVAEALEGRWKADVDANCSTMSHRNLEPIDDQLLLR